MCNKSICCTFGVQDGLHLSTHFLEVHELNKHLSRSSFSSLKKVLFNVCILFLRQRQSRIWGGTEREGGTESEGGSRLRAVSTEPKAGLELVNREITA